MAEIWKEAAKEFLDALAHSMAALFGERLKPTDNYNRYRLRGKTYLIKKE